MVITGLALQNLRLHKSFTLKFESKTTIIVGANAIGKTSIVEALALLATGNSFRAGRVEEMINFDADIGRVKGIISYEPSGFDNDLNANSEITQTDSVAHLPKSINDSNNHKKLSKEIDNSAETDEIEVILTRGEVNGKRTQHRLFSVNGVRRRKKDAAGKFFTVVFRPEDMRLIEGSPSRRRSFLNTVLSMMHSEYEVALKNYDQTLKRRNKLLYQVREREQSRTTLHYWNINLVKYGKIIQKYRKDFIASFAGVEFPVNFEVEYDPSVISQDRIDQYINKEIASGHTLIGPHKDDIIVFLNGDISNSGKKRRIRLDTYGSRGQQRLGVLWLKFCELEYLSAATNTLRGTGTLRDTGKKTLLLLDDILSELDDDSKVLALSVLKNYQSVVTTTDEGVVAEIQKNSGDSVVIRL